MLTAGLIAFALVLVVFAFIELARALLFATQQESQEQIEDLHQDLQELEAQRQALIAEHQLQEIEEADHLALIAELDQSRAALDAKVDAHQARLAPQLARVQEQVQQWRAQPPCHSCEALIGPLEACPRCGWRPES